MIKFAVYARVSAGKEGQLKEALREYLPAVREESGTIQYDVCQAESDPASFLFFEAYEDEAAQRHHTESQAFKAYMEKIRPLLDSSPLALGLIESAKE